MKIGVLADTHGLLRPETLAALEGCEAILHAGDIDRRKILNQLGKIAPVYAVRGNNDKDWAEDLPELLELELAGLRVCMAHKKKKLPEDLKGFQLAVCGHSHKYVEERRGETLLLNPGSCGPRRFGQPVTLAVLEADGGRVSATRIDLPNPEPKGGKKG